MLDVYWANVFAAPSAPLSQPTVFASTAPTTITTLVLLAAVVGAAVAMSPVVATSIATANARVSLRITVSPYGLQQQRLMGQAARRRRSVEPGYDSRSSLLPGLTRDNRAWVPGPRGQIEGGAPWSGGLVAS